MQLCAAPYLDISEMQLINPLRIYTQPFSWRGMSAGIYFHRVGLGQYHAMAVIPKNGKIVSTTPYCETLIRTEDASIKMIDWENWKNRPDLMTLEHYLHLPKQSVQDLATVKRWLMGPAQRKEPYPTFSSKEGFLLYIRTNKVVVKGLSYLEKGVWKIENGIVGSFLWDALSPEQQKRMQADYQQFVELAAERERIQKADE